MNLSSFFCLFIFYFHVLVCNNDFVLFFLPVKKNMMKPFKKRPKANNHLQLYRSAKMPPMNLLIV